MIEFDIIDLEALENPNKLKMFVSRKTFLIIRNKSSIKIIFGKLITVYSGSPSGLLLLFLMITSISGLLGLSSASRFITSNAIMLGESFAWISTLSIED